MRSEPYVSLCHPQALSATHIKPYRKRYIRDQQPILAPSLSLLTSTNHLRIAIQAQLLRRLPKRIQRLLHIEARVPRPADHLDEPVRDRPAVEADVANAGGVAEVADGAGEEGVPGDGLDGDDEAFALGVSVGGAEALADGESLKG